MTRWFFIISSLLCIITSFHSSCNAPKHKGYVNADGIWVDTVHITVRDTVVKHIKVTETFPDVPYYSLIKTNKFSYIPSPPTSWVNDYSNILKPQQRRELDSIILKHYNAKHEQIAIAIIDTLKGKVIDDVSRELYENWQLWRNNGNKGVLMLISIKDRGTVIEVGSGHKEYFTMDVNRDIIKTEMIPEFRKGRYYEGIRDGLNGILFVLNSH